MVCTAMPPMHRLGVSWRGHCPCTPPTSMQSTYQRAASLPTSVQLVPSSAMYCATSAWSAAGGDWPFAVAVCTACDAVNTAGGVLYNAQ